MLVGVLALQGDFAAHRRVLAPEGVEVEEVRRVAQLQRLDGLVLPGGESTTLLNLMNDEPWFDSLRAYHRAGGWILGTCAGTILLAREVLHPVQPSLGLLDAVVARNGFGRQLDSFETVLEVPVLGGGIEAVFIRAPRFRTVGENVKVLARLLDEPVAVEQERVTALTFHPELAAESAFHRRFVQRIRDAKQSEARVAC